MPIFDLFSKRQRRLRGELPDVYKYDELPDQFHGQVVHILKDAYGLETEYSDGGTYLGHVQKILCREYGVAALTQRRHQGRDNDLIAHILTCSEYERVLDAIELACHYRITLEGDGRFAAYAQPSMDAKEMVEEINGRFHEHGLGYQLQEGKLMRVDSLAIHTEAVKPALQLLSAKRYQGANDEYLKAHDHYRHGRYKECLNECLKAFESTMKTICDRSRWQYKPTDTAKVLINTCLQNGLIPSHLQSHFSGLRATLEGGVPTIRNKLGGHGQGTEVTTVPRYIAGYALHLTASNIVMLVEAEKELE